MTDPILSFHHRHIERDEPIGSFCDATPPRWKRWHVALMLLAAIAGVIGLAANEQWAAREEARTDYFAAYQARKAALASQDMTGGGE